MSRKRKEEKTKWSKKDFFRWRLQLIKERHQELILSPRGEVLDEFLTDDDDDVVDDLDMPPGYENADPSLQSSQM